MPLWFDCFVRLALYDEEGKSCNTTISVVRGKNGIRSVEKGESSPVLPWWKNGFPGGLTEKPGLVNGSPAKAPLSPGKW
jgi:hypothetical protein